MKSIRNTLSAAVCLAALAGAAHAAGPDMKALMLQGHEKMMAVQMTGKPDVDFAIAMREHHVGALDMARWELEHGKDPKMKAMARKIMADQQKEIAQFDEFLARAGHKPAPAAPGAAGGHGDAHPQK